MDDGEESFRRPDIISMSWFPLSGRDYPTIEPKGNLRQ
jgi:hypothetical protein